MPVLLRRFCSSALTIALCFVCLQLSLSAAQGPQTALTLTPQQQDQLRDLAKRVLSRAARTGCKKRSCTILVANFAGPSGSTTFLGMQLADSVSMQLAAQSGEIHVADRQRLQSFLEKERIDSKLLEEDNAARWLAMESSANAVLVGYLKESSSGAGVLLRVQLLDAHRLLEKREEDEEPAKESPVEEVSLDGLNNALYDAEPFNRDAPRSQPEEGSAMYRAGSGGVSTPACQRCPNPSYTSAARIAGFQGTLVLSVTISPEGSAQDIQIVKGVPYGLNQSAIQAVSRWNFKPALLAGQAVPALTPIQVSFRLY